VLEHELRPALGAKKKRKRVGRGLGSGHGTYAGRGNKGQKARTGGSIRPTFEGGQLPLSKRMPHKRGFKNVLFRIVYREVNVGRLEVLPPNADVTAQTLEEAGLIRGGEGPVKVLGHGSLRRPLTVHVDKATAKARRKIEAAGGRLEEG